MMVARGATLDTRRAIAYAGLAAAGVGALGVQITCPKLAPMHLLVWHLGPALALPVAAAVAGAPLFARWMRHREAGGQRT